MPSRFGRTLTPTRLFIRSLGGTGAVARALGVIPTVVSNWAGERHPIPAKHHLALWRLAQQRGVFWQPPGTEGLTLTVTDMTSPQPSDAPAFPQCSHDEPSAQAPAEAAE
jgi:hypothetical protein